MKKLLLLPAPLLMLLSGCVNSTTYMKNEKTGEVVTCGGTHAVTVVETAVQRREAQCIQDYKERGFVRVAGPNSN